MTLEEEFGKQIKVAIDLEQLAKPLQELLSGRYSVWHDGRLYHIKALVEQVRDLKVIIRSNDHPPPHFHVLGQKFSASFEIESGDLLEGQIDTLHHRLIRVWHKTSIPLLHKIWLETRPGS